MDVDADEDEYIIEINSELALHFTQTHIAEIQEIFRLLSEYGTPQEMDEDGEVSGQLLQPVRSSFVEQVQKDEPSAALYEDVHVRVALLHIKRDLQVVRFMIIRCSRQVPSS